MKLFFLLSSILFLCNCYGQFKHYQPDIDDVNSVKYFKIKSSDIAIDTVQYNQYFKYIDVEDFRYDTTNIGSWAMVHYYPYYTEIENRKITFENGLNEFLKFYLSNIYKNVNRVNDLGLVCFIKQFYTKQDDTITQNLKHDENYGELRVDVECYYEKDGNYFPALKVDTTIFKVIDVSKKDVTTSFANFLITDFLKSLINKINKTDVHRVLQRKYYKKDEMFDKYWQRFQLPILTASQYTKGVYANFEEFKNNNPSIKEFTIKKERYHSDDLIDGEGNTIISTKIFGYSDGKKIYIQLANFTYELFRVGNGFELFISTSKALKVLALLNMETGKPYQ